MKAIAVHVGAGKHSRGKWHRYRTALCTACRSGLSVPSADALSSVASAVVSLEDDPCTNAGNGSNLNERGVVECDACAMYSARAGGDGVSDTRTVSGGVGALWGVRNPISVAVSVARERAWGPLPLGRIRPSLLVGEGAREWALERGFTVSDDRGLLTTDESLMQFHDHTSLVGEQRLDTVGAVAADSLGGVAAAVSSGGISLKHSGRVGEAALAGCGCWSSTDGVAVSVSGVGEDVMSALLAVRCAEAIVAHCDRGDISSVMGALFSPHPGLIAGALCLRRIGDCADVIVTHTAQSFAVAYAVCDSDGAAVESEAFVSRKGLTDRPVTSVHRLRLKRDANE